MSIQDQITAKLTKAFSPSLLEVTNESHLHAGHAGDDGSGETHFRVKIVSTGFAGMSRIETHRAITNLLQDELTTQIHALAITATAPRSDAQ